MVCLLADLLVHLTQISSIQENMDAQYERRLLLSMNGQNSLSVYSSPIQSPIKSSDRYIPLRSSLSALNLHYPLNTSSCSSSSSTKSRRTESTSPTTSPNKKCKYDENLIGLSSGVTAASQPDLAVYEQLLQNTLLNTKIDTISDVQTSTAPSTTTTTTTVDQSNCSFSSIDNSQSIFRYSERRPDSDNLSSTTKTSYHINRSPMSNASLNLLFSPKKTVRHIPESPYKVLDAPELQDDFYLNLIDWSSANILSVGLGTCVYVYNAKTNQVQLLTDLSQTHISSNIIGSDSVTSVQWSSRPNILAIGKNMFALYI